MLARSAFAFPSICGAWPPHPRAVALRLCSTFAGDALPALQACGRRGRWKTAMDLLADLEASAGGAPIPAYRSALLACRKKERHGEAADILRRMGESADAAAYNEVLHLLRLKGDFDGSLQLWERMPMRERDSLGYYHLLHICGDDGRWQKALELIEEIRGRFGDGALQSGHYLAGIRACSRDRRWEEAVALAHTMPAAILGEVFLAKAALAASILVRAASPTRGELAVTSLPEIGPR